MAEAQKGNLLVYFVSRACFIPFIIPARAACRRERQRRPKERHMGTIGNSINPDLQKESTWRPSTR
jgi:hypothetical protein